jgi:hypothetical protein
MKSARNIDCDDPIRHESRASRNVRRQGYLDASLSSLNNFAGSGVLRCAQLGAPLGALLTSKLELAIPLGMNEMSTPGEDVGWSNVATALCRRTAM